MPRVLFVDDHPLLCEGFCHLAQSIRPDWSVDVASTVAEAVDQFNSHPASIVIVDIFLCGEDGFELLERLKILSASTPVIVISGRDDIAIRSKAKAAGAKGFVTKTTALHEIISTIDLVLNGGTHFDKADDQTITLTARQAEVLALLGQGHSNKEIRHRLDIAERTVRSHLTEVFQVLGVSSRMQAVIRARELGLIL